MNTTIEQVTPEVAQALVKQATVQGLSVNDYLRGLLGMSNGAAAKLAVADAQPAAPQLQTAEPAPRNEEMLAIIRGSRERMKDMPVRGSAEETLLMIRKARAGEMWGYEPTDFE